MESIIVYPENEKQKSLLKSLLAELKIRFEMGKADESAALTEEAFIGKIDKAIRQAEAGETRVLSKEEQKALLGL